MKMDMLFTDYFLNSNTEAFRAEFCKFEVIVKLANLL